MLLLFTDNIDPPSRGFALNSTARTQSHSNRQDLEESGSVVIA